ncbi:MAG: peptidoglycan-binding protein [Acidobacteriaceae bacterium]|nr:peptidoglycan-binding protein [Acidobacteriaceae bacterium]
MQRVFLLVLLGTAAVGPTLCNAQSSKAAAHKASAKSKNSAHLVPAGSSNSHSGANAHGRGKTHARHVPPPPSYQLHPDAERYQQIQQALADKGYFKGPVNGEWGDDSVDAMRRFQTDQKLDTPDGKITALSLIGLGLGPKHDGSTAPMTTMQHPADTSHTGSLPPPDTPPAPAPNFAPPD